MKLNEKEKEEFVKYLKKQYKENSELIERNEFPLCLDDDKKREDFIAYTQKLKEDYEAIERGEEFEISLPFNFKGDNAWFGILGLAIIAGLMGGFNSNSLDNPDDSDKIS